MANWAVIFHSASSPTSRHIMLPAISCYLSSIVTRHLLEKGDLAPRVTHPTKRLRDSDAN
ncbi:hypothetical protein [Vibrio hangzhouensis]|uniref:Uncharacterized protein n=1 Tax=Vibrio hangzhouensis TaxID=462991 RepID=A0A1H6BUX4_9VIBR|nr:hypothetical protein [Vibrio hangzhouensis]SEG64026.1 hypothetical protein SAMN04488244_12567 [Vibrio hangzhouensis]